MFRSSELWAHIALQNEAEFSTRTLPNFCGRDGTRFVGKTRLIWPMVGGGHFAVLGADADIAHVTVYDSICSSATGWLKTGCLMRQRVEQMLALAFPTVRFHFAIGESAQQQNGCDCGVYAMANVRSHAFDRPLQGKQLRQGKLGNWR